MRLASFLRRTVARDNIRWLRWGLPMNLCLQDHYSLGSLGNANEYVSVSPFFVGFVGVSQ